MKQTHIPLINDKLDLSILAQILRKGWWVCVMLLAMSVSLAFIYLRYTKPLYESSCVIQINEEDRSANMLNFSSQYNRTDLSKVLELMRSKEFLKRALNELPLEISYFNEGTFMSFEMYPEAPFSIELGSHNGDLYNRPFYIDFTDSLTAKITFKGAKNSDGQLIKLDEWEQVGNTILKCSVSRPREIAAHATRLGERYFVIINDPRNIINEHSRNLDISLLNSAAQTIKITYTGHNANKTWHIVNTIAEEYLKYDVRNKRESAANILSFIDDQLKSIYNSLDETEKQIQTFKKKNNIKTQSEPAVNASAQKAENLEEKVTELDYEMLAIEQIKARLEAGGDINTYEMQAVLAGTKAAQLMSNILSNLQRIIDERQQLLNSLTIDNIKVKQVENRLENQIELTIDFVNTTLARMREQKAEYKAQISEIEKWLFNEKNYDELEYARLQRMYEVNQTYYNQLIDKKAEYLISQAGYISRNTILESASTPDAPVSPKAGSIYFVFVALGLLFGFVYLTVRYLIYSEITSVSMVQNYTQAPILGVIPQYDEVVDVSQLLVMKDPHSPFSEAFRSIRSNLQFISHGADTHIVTVSSTVSGEGKTFVSINLGGIIATSGKRVILLDLDLRKPRIHQGFKVDNSKGMSTILIGRNQIEECVHHTEIENFDFITAGPLPPNPSELAGSKEMDDVIDRLQKMYDVIIIDTPPVGIVSDAVISLHRANYPIYVMKMGVSKRQYIENVNMLRSDKNMEHLSIILNGASLKSHSHYGYGYGYGYGEQKDGHHGHGHRHGTKKTE